MIPISDFKLNHREELPQYVQLYLYFQKEIMTGKLTQNDRMPSIRKLADFLGVSITPVEMAYDQLVAEGFIYSKPRSGYYITAIQQEMLYKKSSSYEVKKYTNKNKNYAFDFHISKNDFTVFPFMEWKKIYTECLNIKDKELLFYGEFQGELDLRIEISKYLGKYRGVICDPEQIVIGSEQHQITSLLCLILKNHSKKLAIEDPSYLLIPKTFEKNGYEIIPLPMKSDGICLDRLLESDARVVCVSPSHQFPTGIMMPISNRIKLIQWAVEKQGYIIEDDYDGEFRYHGRPLPALQGMSEDHVIYLGGFSQVLAPGIGVTYMVLPKNLLHIYRQLHDELLFEQSASRIHQNVLSRFMERGYLEKHMRKTRNIYRKKHDLVIRYIELYFCEKINILGIDAGFHLFLELDSEKSEEELVTLAKQVGIHIASAAYTRHTQIKGKPQFILGFASIEPPEIEQGIKLLSEVWNY